ncbi:hypothetical protein QR680_004246 [Steinernema hermaphroditum]|uniref:Uncharacterized protein n=1 Tax=Steinernema hermaphroditum TaxID=289476 RepID=A0AA39LTC5_9BILA|nr:hypothetical protein QR680_004246 [Steinernema hermaphroditum]
MGLVLNIIGSVMGYLRAEIDENIVESIVDSRLREYGIVNGTRNITGAFGVEIDLGEEPYQPSAIVLVMLTTFGRMFNVIGTIKMYRPGLPHMLFTGILFCFVSVSTCVQLVPNNPHVFGSLLITGLNASIEYSIVSDRSLLCKLPPAPNITVPCRCLPFSSPNYRILDDTTGTVVKEFEVQSPEVKIIVPDTHRVLTGLETIFEPSLCEAHVFRVAVEHRPFEVIPGKENDWESVSNGQLLLFNKREIRDIACDDFDIPGFYRVRLSSAVDPNTTVISPIIKVNISANVPPSIHIRSDAIFPHCNGEFTVSWKIPYCQTSKQAYRIRAFAVEEERPDELILMDDSPVNRSITSLGIPCHFFDILYRQFCFELFTIADHTRRFVHWDQKCVYTEHLKRIDGGWSTWTEWSQCTVSCGSGIQRRVRFCNNPVTVKGNYCKGDFIESRACDNEDCPVTKRNIEIRLSDCDCGCHLPARSGSFFAGEKRCDSGRMEWTIPKNEYQRVRITVANHTRHGEVLRITNGNLLYDSRMDHGKHQFYADMDFPIVVVFYRSGNGSKARNRSKFIEGTSGFIVEYLISDVPPRQITFQGVRSESSAWVSFSCPVCSLPFVAAFLSVIFLIIILLPPVFCTIVTKRKIEKRLRKRSSTSSKRNINEMVRSNNTDSTQATAQIPLKAAISRRSIGIQLSVQSTPRFPRGITRNHSISARGTPRDQLSAMSFTGESGELEYDYYDHTLPDSFLAPNGRFASEIDIDQIIHANAPWALQNPIDVRNVETSDANTQI